MNPILTVIIPVYNCEKYVERAAMSVLNQPCPDRIELILVDDGSKDGSGKIIDRIAEKHGNVRVFHKENGGVSSARNLGMENAQGKYIAFLDSDDWWEPDFFDCELAEKMNDSESADVFQFQYREIDADYRLEKLHRVDSGVFTFDKPALGRLEFDHHCRLIYKLEYIKKMKLSYPPTKIREDILFAELAMCFAKKVEAVAKTIFTYWINRDSCMHITDGITMHTESCKSIGIEKQFLNEHGIEYENEIERFYLSSAVSALWDYCAAKSLKSAKAMACSDVFSIFGDESITPWPHLQKKYDLWKKHPRLFWLRSRLSLRGIRIRAKNLICSTPVLFKPANYIFLRFAKKWQKVKTV